MSMDRSLKLSGGLIRNRSVLTRAERIAKLPQDVLQLNKRTIHRQMEVMGFRNGIRAGTELCTLGIHTATMAEFLGRTQGGARLTEALQQRDAQFGDYRTAHEREGN